LPVGSSPSKELRLEGLETFLLLLLASVALVFFAFKELAHEVLARTLVLNLDVFLLLFNLFHALVVLKLLTA